VKALVDSYFQALDMIGKDKQKAFTIMGADVKQTAEQFEKSQAKIKWADREANKKFFNGEIQAFNKEAAELLLEIGVIKSKPENMDTLFDTTYIK
jgi:NitT/TauT family transport system substrate-binding protein